MIDPNRAPQIDEPSEELKTEYRNRITRLTHHTRDGEREGLLVDGRKFMLKAPEVPCTPDTFDEEVETHFSQKYEISITEEVPRPTGGKFLHRKTFSLGPDGLFTKSDETTTYDAEGKHIPMCLLSELAERIRSAELIESMGLNRVTGLEAAELVELLRVIPEEA